MIIATRPFLLAVSIAASAAGQVSLVPAHAQAPVTGAVGEPYQRSIEIYEMKTIAKSGPLRGEEIYYFKCWFCHNELAKAGPPLKGLFSRQTLVASRAQVNDVTVADKI